MTGGGQQIIVDFGSKGRVGPAVAHGHGPVDAGVVQIAQQRVRISYTPAGFGNKAA